MRSLEKDGQRIIVYVPGGGTVEFRSRSGENNTAAYPDLHGLGST
jgi:bifunctional non-homologous end joining protein LigD